MEKEEEGERYLMLNLAAAKNQDELIFLYVGRRKKHVCQPNKRHGCGDSEKSNSCCCYASLAARLACTELREVQERGLPGFTFYLGGD